MRCELSVMCCLVLFVVRWLLLVVCGLLIVCVLLLFGVWCLVFGLWCLLLRVAVSRMLFCVVLCGTLLLFGVRCVLFVVCWFCAVHGSLLFVV